jgi:hypothetical protein
MRTLAAATAVALLAAPAAAQQPEMAHLSLTGKPGEMAVDFASHPRDGTPPASYGCLLGTTPSPRQFFPAYNFTNFTSQDEAFGGQTFLHQVLFTGLSAGTQYFYVCGSEATKDPWSRVYDFTYTPAASRYAVVRAAGERRGSGEGVDGTGGGERGRGGCGRGEAACQWRRPRAHARKVRRLLKSAPVRLQPAWCGAVSVLLAHPTRALDTRTRGARWPTPPPLDPSPCHFPLPSLLLANHFRSPTPAITTSKHLATLWRLRRRAPLTCSSILGAWAAPQGQAPRRGYPTEGRPGVSLRPGRRPRLQSQRSYGAPLAGLPHARATAACGVWRLPMVPPAASRSRPYRYQPPTCARPTHPFTCSLLTGQRLRIQSGG